MKKLFFSVAFAAVMLGLSSCSIATSIISGAEPGLIGSVYVGVTQPQIATSNTVGNKVGTVSAVSILGVAAFGDGSINKAAKMAGITKISHVDVKTTSILGLFTSKKFFVYGE